MQMGESSNVVFSAEDTSVVERKMEAASPCINITNATSTNTSKDAHWMLSPECSNLPVPFPSPDFRRLAELYWKYPTVHQTFVVSPGLHTNQALLAKARRKSEKLRLELEREPERHRVSAHNSHNAAAITRSKSSGSKKSTDVNRRESRKSRGVIAATAPVQQRRRTVNMSIVAPTTKNVNVNRRLTLQPVNRSQNRKSKVQKASDPGTALAEFRTSKGFAKPTTPAEKTPVPVYTETPVVLEALREQREDLEKREVENSQASQLLKINQKFCDAFRQCMGSYRVTCIASFVLVTIIIILSITAIVYPIARAIMLQKGSKSKSN